MKKFLQRIVTISNAAIITLLLSGVTGILTFGGTAQAVLQERTLATGSTSANGSQGEKWRKISFNAAQTGTGTFRLTWTGVGDLRFQVLRANNAIIGGNITNAASPKTYSTSLTANTAYFVTIWAYSGVGNFTMTLTENFPNTDTTPPSVPLNLSSDQQTTNSIRLLWNPSTDNVGVTSYRVYRGATLVGSPAGTSYTDIGLAEATQYSYTVRAVDAGGNLSAASAVFAVSTLASGPPDTEAPSVPDNLQSSGVSHNAATVTWNPSTDNKAVTSYRVFRNGTQVGTPATSTFADGGLTPETEYTYTVQALDAVPNASEQSAGLVVTTLTAPVATSKPNVIVINLDDMGAADMASLPKVRSWMADGGTNFPNGYVATPSCCPSRAALMSGRYVHNNGQYGQDNQGLNLNLTVQRYLHDAGYFTGHAGKYVHWQNINQTPPYWDRWTHFKGGYSNVLMRFDNQTRTSQGYSTTITFDKGIEYVRGWETQEDNKPFFVQLTPVAPHSPSTPEAKYASSSVPAPQQKPSHNETDRSDKPPFVAFTNVNYASGTSSHTAMVRTLYSVDDQVDRLMKELQTLGELDNTLIFFTSDNGYFFGEHGRSSKFLPYNEAVNVPFLIRWPGHVAPGATDSRRVSHVDITPTILAAAGVTQSQVALDGHDILSGYTRPHAYSEYYYDTANANYITTWSSIRNNQYMYTEYYGQNTTRTTPSFREYYDMVNDPYQMTNLLKDNTTANDPDVNALSAILASYRDCVGSSCQ